MTVDAAPMVLVVVPAHDEAERIGACLRSLVDAARLRPDHSVMHVVVVAHRCTDLTATVARRELSSVPVALLTHQVMAVQHDVTVGAVRTLGVRHALDHFGFAPTARDWLFSTDADTEVPPRWILDGLAEAERTSAAMLLGLIELSEAKDELRRRHDLVVAAGVAPDGSHSHAYAANLLVRLDAFTEAGGFPAVPHGEEHALAARLRAAGRRVVATSRWTVSTSGRTRGRAVDGLHAVLRRLQDEPDPDDRNGAGVR